MNTFRKFLKSLQAASTRTASGPAAVANPPRIDFSYTIYWTKHARQWNAARRLAVHEALLKVLAQPGFEANAYERRYTVPGLDDQAHAGASLIALKKVLAALDENETPS